VFAAVAVILRIVHERSTRLESFHLGRTSTLNLMSDPSLNLCSKETPKSVKNYAKYAAKLTNIVKPTLPGSIVSGDEEIRQENHKCTLNVKRSVGFNDAPQYNFYDNYDDKSIDGETQKYNSNAKRSVTLNGFPGVDVHDSFDETAPLSHLKGSFDDIIDSGGHPTASNDETDLDRRIQKIVDSGAIDDVLECLQEMKRSKKA